MGMRSVYDIVEEQGQGRELVVNRSDAYVEFFQGCFICERQNVWSTIVDMAHHLGGAVVHDQVPC